MRHPYTLHKTLPRRKRPLPHAVERFIDTAGYQETPPSESAVGEDRTLTGDCALLQRAPSQDEARGGTLEAANDDASVAESQGSRRPRQRGVE
jgi:hypothetical protein